MPPRPSAVAAGAGAAGGGGSPKGPPTLTKEQALALEDELIAEYRTEAFQAELHRAWDEAGDDVVRQGRARQATCMPVQSRVIPKYGFEASRAGVHHSVLAFRPFAGDPAFTTRDGLMGWLMNPALQRTMLPGATPKDVAAAAADMLAGRQPGTATLRGGAGASAEQAAKARLMSHLDASWPLLYGSWMGKARAPSAFLRAEGWGELAAYLRDDPEGPFAGAVDPWPATMRRRGGSSGSSGGLAAPQQQQQQESQTRWDQWEFEMGEGEPLLKADWHTVHGWGYHTPVFVPRAASTVSVRRAPRRVLAFIEAFREVNQSCWAEMLDSLDRLKKEAPAGSDLPWVADVVSSSIRSRSQFGAVEAQVWWGPESITTRSHKDGATSLLHLSITLSGSRSVRVGAQRTPTAADVWREGEGVAQDEDVWNEEVWNDGCLRTVQMKPGTVYCSSPFVFEHGVRYEGCSSEEPIIALQCRFAFPNETAAGRVNALRSEEMRAAMEAVAGSMRNAADRGEMRLPELEEIQLTEQQIALRLAAVASGRF